jgi:drug/metabolite transporter (DMT)-like permease
MKTPRHKIIGIIVGLGGSIGIVLSDTNDLTGTNNIFALFVIGAVIMYAFSINIIKFKLADLDGITITVIAFSMIGWVAGISIFFTDFEPVLATPDWQMNLLYICILGIAGSSIAVAFFYILLDYVTVVFGSLITYIIPLFAVFWGLFDGESVTWVQILFMAVVLFGVWLVNKKKQKLPGKSSDSK